ncbi:MAG: haloacid dehalogenase type II, partial [Candidatus Competibacter sp.]|nr:haloacid dehalogenase type II [Candidatus Competibacter sp.]
MELNVEKTYALGFDVYGTLVDPLALAEPLQALVGEQAVQFAQLWRTKQLEYSFRRGLMRRYADFDNCTRQALCYTQQVLRCELPESDRDRLLEAYLYLPMFPEVPAGLAALKAQGHQRVAFSNGVEASIRALLVNADVLPLLEDVVSVDDLRTFKPDPEVYAYLARRT